MSEAKQNAVAPAQGAANVEKTQGGAVQPAPKQSPVKAPPTLDQILNGDRFALALKKVLPKYLTPELFVGIVAGQMKRNPLLGKCDQKSFFECLMKCAEVGLMPNGTLAYLIPFKNGRLSKDVGHDVYECQLIIGYRGFVELAKRSGSVKSIYAEMVCENDYFENDCGEIHHRIDYRRDRGQPYAAVVVITSPDGEKQSCVMQMEEIEFVRNNAQSYQQYIRKCAYNEQKGWDPPAPPPWVQYFSEMAKKTCFRRLCKWLVTTPQFQMAEELDNADYIDAEYSEGAYRVKESTPRKIYGEQPKQIAAQPQQSIELTNGQEREKVPASQGDPQIENAEEGAF